MGILSPSGLLALAKGLQRAETVGELLAATRAEIDGAWLIVPAPENGWRIVGRDGGLDDDLREKALHAGAPLVQKDAEGFVVYIGLAVDQSPTGALAVGPLAEAPSAGDRSFLVEAASQLAPAVRRIFRLQMLIDMSRVFSAAAADLPTLLGLIARRLTELIGEGCIIQLVAKDGLSIQAVAIDHVDDAKLATLRVALDGRPLRMGEGITGKVAATGEAINAPALRTPELLALEPPHCQALVRELAMESVLALPLKSRGVVFGVLTLGRSIAGRPFTADDRRMAQDLADRAALTIDSARLVANFEERVAERTAGMEDAAKELEAFSYSLAHDLRSPLRGINGFSAAIAEDYGDRLDEAGKRYLKRIAGGAMQMGEIIDALLSLARLSRVVLRNSLVDLSQIARFVIEELRSDEPRRKVDFVAADGLVIVGDPQLLRAALENLLRNAWKFTSKRPHARIEFGHEQTNEGGTFFVRDDGAGFDMTHGSKLFRPFQRLHTTDEFEGTGIGLAIVQRIVRRHGGRIWAEGAVDAGATIRFTLQPGRQASDGSA